MSMTAEQVGRRRKFITASDAAAVLGFSPFRNAADVLYEKLYEMRPLEPHEAMLVGCDFEAPLVEYWRRNRNYTDAAIWRGRWWSSGVLGATLDAIHDEGDPPKRPDRACEAKTAGVLTPFAVKDEDWGEFGTDEIPVYYTCQCLAQMAVVETIEAVDVPAVVGRRGLGIYTVPRVADAVREVGEQLTEWYLRHVRDGVPLDSNAPPPSIDTLRRVERAPASTVEIDDSLVDAWLDAKGKYSEAQSELDLRRDALIASLGGSEAGRCGHGTFLYRQESAGLRVDFDRLKSEMPSVYAQYAGPTFRMMPRWKPPK